MLFYVAFVQCSDACVELHKEQHGEELLGSFINKYSIYTHSTHILHQIVTSECVFHY